MENSNGQRYSDKHIILIPVQIENLMLGKIKQEK